MVTLVDVARVAGVSVATASRAINGSRDRVVGTELRERVLAAAAQLNYVPNATAQAMAWGRTSTIGLVVNDIADPFFADIASGVARAAARHSALVSLFTTENSFTRKLQILEAMRTQRARSVILAGALTDDPRELRALAAAVTALTSSADTTVTLIGPPCLGLPCVHLDNAGGVKDLAEALLGLGHRRFGILAGPPLHMTARERTSAFAAAVEAGGGEVIARVPCTFDRAGGVRGMRELLAGTRPDVVFATNDLVAIGAMSAARELGVRVPEDVGVAGFDDIAASIDVVPELTTVAAPLDLLGETAVEIAVGELETPATLPMSVVLRGSTAR